MLSLRSGLFLFYQEKRKSLSAAVSRGKIVQKAKPPPTPPEGGEFPPIALKPNDAKSSKTTVPLPACAGSDSYRMTIVL